MASRTALIAFMAAAMISTCGRYDDVRDPRPPRRAVGPPGAGARRGRYSVRVRRPARCARDRAGGRALLRSRAGAEGDPAAPRRALPAPSRGGGGEPARPLRGPVLHG